MSESMHECYIRKIRVSNGCCLVGCSFVLSAHCLIWKTSCMLNVCECVAGRIMDAW